MTTKKEKYRQSETVIIKRSQIKFAPYNPKVHTKELINEIKKNIKRVAFLGGIIWNETTGNLIDGHKRVNALDVIYKYDGTPETNYDIKVEKIALDEKTEKEQNIFQTKSRTDLDKDLVASLLPEIDYANAGLDEIDLSIYKLDVPITTEVYDFNPQQDREAIEENELNIETEAKEDSTYEEKKAKVKEMKEKFKEEAIYDGDPYVTISFDDYVNKVFFMESLGLSEDTKFIKGEELLERLT